MKKHGIKIAISILLLSVITYYLMPKYEFEYFYSPNNKNVITRIAVGSFPDYVYYTYGYYKQREVPSTYIAPRSVSGFGEGYYLYIHWSDSICTIYNSVGLYDTINLNNSFRFETITEYSDQWQMMMKDTTKQSIRDGSFDFVKK
ncbi:MAG: hypothetical protein JEZ14_01580 [Marinilabiliaceae bacterium]|nr:hypothetical protein [Marinilabiliaceae bacterium]